MKIKLSFLGKISKKDYIRLGLVAAVFIIAGLFFLFLRQYAVKLAQPEGITWYNHGPGMGGRVPKVTIDQTTPNIIYLGTDVSGIFKSENSGESWRPINNGLDNYDSGGVTIDNQDHNILYTITDSGIFKSLDAGNTWNKKNSEVKATKWKGTTGAGTLQIVQGKNNLNILYALSWEGNFRADNSNNTFSVYQSGDRGETWIKKSGSNPLVLQPDADPKKGNVIRAITIDQEDANIVYLGSDLGLFKTTDGGQNWQKVATLENKIRRLMGYNEDGTTDQTSIIDSICRADMAKGYFVRNTGETDQDQLLRCQNTYQEGLYDSYQGKKIYPGYLDIRSITINPVNRNHLFVLSSWGHIYSSQDGGQNWQEVYHRDNPLDSTRLGHLDLNKNFVWNDRDWYSFDSIYYNSGQTKRYDVNFQTIKIDINPDAENINKCRLDSSPSNCDYYLYINHEASWQSRKEIWRIQSQNIKFDNFAQESTPQIDGKYATVYRDGDTNRDGQLEREDIGELWKLVLNYDAQAGNLNRNNWPLKYFWQGFAGTDMFDLDLSSPFPNRKIYATGMWGAVKAVASQKYQQINNSSDADSVNGYYYNYEWDWTYKGLENYVVNQVIYDPIDPNLVYFTASDLGFMRSTDGGKNFERSLNGVFMPGSAGWRTPDGQSEFGGHGWAFSVNIENNQTVLYLGLSSWNYTGGKIYKSKDRGQSWQDISGNLPPHLKTGGSGRINQIIVNPQNPNQIFISMWNLYPSTETLNSVQNCLQIHQGSGIDPLVYNPLCNYSQSLTDKKSINAGGPLWQTNDGGQNWQKVNEGSGNGLPTSSYGELAVDFQNNILYYGVFDYTDGIDTQSPGYGLYKSTDLGQSWTKLDMTIIVDGSPLALRRITDLEINPFDQNDLMALSLYWRHGGGADAYLIRSRDAGNTWSKIGYYPETDLGQITFDPYRPGRIALNFNNYDGGGKIGFVISNDNGQNFTQENTNIPSLITNSTAFHPTDPGKILLGLSGSGLAWSYDVFASATSTSSPTPTTKTTKKISPTPAPTATSTPLNTPEPTSEETTIPPDEESSPDLNTSQISRKITPTPTTPAPTTTSSGQTTLQTTPSSSTEVSPSQSPEAQQLTKGSKQKRNIGIVLGIIACGLFGFIFYKRFKENNR